MLHVAHTLHACQLPRFSDCCSRVGSHGQRRWGRGSGARRPSQRTGRPWVQPCLATLQSSRRLPWRQPDRAVTCGWWLAAQWRI